uniref:Uncharacterized protein n=1 Tax=Meloidogyne enterolobii TaxID=390850 RepID=A0A6V7WFQ0_MELEN|nr:unnamed protein product [Meloidogyne enterolobii]
MSNDLEKQLIRGRKLINEEVNFKKFNKNFLCINSINCPEIRQISHLISQISRRRQVE